MQLLALAVEPDDQRRRQGRAAGPATSGPSRRRRRCGASTSPAALTLMDYCTAGPQYASGGFIADSALDGFVINGSQQQFLVRDSSIGGWSNGSGTRSSPACRARRAQSFPTPAVHDARHDARCRARSRSSTSTRAGSYSVFVPALQHNSSGTTWQDGQTPGRSIPIDELLRREPGRLARRRSTTRSRAARTCSSRRASTTSTGRSRSSAPDTIVLGLGMATLDAPERRRAR